MTIKMVLLFFLFIFLFILVYSDKVHSIDFDNASFGVSVNMSIPFEWGTSFDNASFGIQTRTGISSWGKSFDNASFGVNIGLTSVSGSSDPGGYWEFYKLNNRYDVNADGYVLSSDANVVWSNREGT